MKILECTDNCLLDWDKLAKFMVEIWTGRRFSFLTERWFRPELVGEMTNLGSCGCIPFNAMQLACFAKSEESIKRLLNMTSKPWELKPPVDRTFSRGQLRRREIRGSDPHPNPTYYHYLKYIIKKAYLIASNPLEYVLVARRYSHHADTPESVAKCLNLLFTNEFTPICDPTLQQRCPCNLLIHTILDYKFSGDIALLLNQFENMWPSIVVGIGVDFTEHPPSVPRDVNEAQIVACIFENEAYGTISFFWSYYYAHSTFNQRIVTGDFVFTRGSRIDDLQRLFQKPDNLKFIEFLALAGSEKNFIIGGEEGEALLRDLKSVHSYFHRVPDLYSLCRNMINQNLPYPYSTSIDSLPLPTLIKKDLPLQ